MGAIIQKGPSKMKEPILVVMAAGIGSRFGGLKQMAPFGLHGESLIDYTLYDALQAGFRRVVFIVNKRIYPDFRKLVGAHVEGRMEVRYVMQELDSLPEGLSVPEGRVKPWGTGHALLCAKDAVDAPFCALNGDDLYGRSALRGIYNHLAAGPEPYHYAMVGFLLKNTLSENGYVSRGVCQVDEAGYLTRVEETTHIIPSPDGPLYTLDEKTYYRLDADTLVSMNIWALTRDFMEELAETFPHFHRRALAENPLRAELYVPTVVGSLVASKKARVKVLSSTDRWFGVTNASDRASVEAGLRELTAQGVYPDGLWV